MSLNFKLDKIKDYKTLCWVRLDADGEKLNPVTDGLIWSTMSIGLGEITEKNINEWLVRLQFSDKLFGTLLIKAGENGERVERPITREELVAHIGLRTNVTNETRAKWMKRMTERFMSDAEYALRKVEPVAVCSAEVEAVA